MSDTVLDALEAVRLFAAERPAGVAIESGCVCWTYRALVSRVEAIAAKLLDADVRSIALCADNGPEWIAIDLAAHLANVTIVPLPPFFSTQQCAHVLADCEVDALVFDGSGERIMGDLVFGQRSTLTETCSMTRLRRASGERSNPRPAKISYTSGTTGSPKGVCLSWSAQNLVANSLVKATAALQIARHTCILPLSVLLENIGGVYAPLIAGATVVCPPGLSQGLSMTGAPDGEALARIIKDTRAESVILLPQLLAALVGEYAENRSEHLSFAAVGGAKTPEKVLHAAQSLGIPVYEGYGLTECSSVVSMNAPGARRIGSVGRPLPHAGVRLAADGEILVDGAILDRYTGDDSTVSEVATGDIGYFDSEGYLYIRGRKKNVFVTSFGRNVSPEWVEASLCASGAIRQAVVFGEAMPCNVAIVYPRSDATPTADIEAGIREANQSLPAYARVARWIRADEPFSPANGLLTPNGRYKRDSILARYGRQIDACYAAELETRKAV
jgi:long-chain acyl-CoA synthetase